LVAEALRLPLSAGLVQELGVEGLRQHHLEVALAWRGGRLVGSLNSRVLQKAQLQKVELVTLRKHARGRANQAPRTRSTLIRSPLSGYFVAYLTGLPASGRGICRAGILQAFHLQNKHPHLPRSPGPSPSPTLPSSTMTCRWMEEMQTTSAVRDVSTVRALCGHPIVTMARRRSIPCKSELQQG